MIIEVSKIEALRKSPRSHIISVFAFDSAESASKIQPHIDWLLVKIRVLLNGALFGES